MEYLDELENMAATTIAQDEEDHEALETQVRHLLDVHRQTVQDEKKEAREGYGDSKTTYLVKLEGPLDSPYKIQNLAGTLELPALVKGIGATGEASFCLIDGSTKRAILQTFFEKPFRPTFIWISREDKNLSDHCIAPTLGYRIEPTLPQHRANDAEHVFLPAQNQYPVWYFFYGTLADPEFLAEKLSLLETPVLREATITDGIIGIWAGKYKALLDGPSTAKVSGWAYEVMSEEHEERLRFYETNKYEVVRCNILMRDSVESVKGLTFRFIPNSGSNPMLTDA
jgi:hypothetical protein